MDAFDDEHVVAGDLAFFTVVETLSGFEGEFRNFDFFSVQETKHVIVERVQIQRVEGFKIVFAFFVPRGVFPVHEVVIEGEIHGFDAVHQELDGKAFPERGFPGRGGTGDENHLYFLVFLLDQVGNLGYFFLVLGFTDFDEHPGILLFDGGIDVADVGGSRGVAPLPVFVEDVE